MSVNRVECACSHGPHFYHFVVETTDSRSGDVSIFLCRKCYDALRAKSYKT